MLPPHSVIILAGGLGTRLRPVLQGQPKVVAPVRKKPFLFYILKQAAQSHPQEIILCLGYGAEKIQQTLAKTQHESTTTPPSSFEGVPLRYSYEKKLLGTGGALRLGLLQTQTPWSLVMNGDSFCHLTFPGLFTWYASHYPQPTLVVTQVEDTSRFGCVAFNEEKKITHFLEKKEVGGPGWINAGLYLVPREFHQHIPPHHPVSLEHDILPRLLQTSLLAYPTQGPFVDMGIPQSYAQLCAQPDFLP